MRRPPADLPPNDAVRPAPRVQAAGPTASHSAPPAPPPSVDPPKPVIRISIGRIDVRATVPPAVPMATPKPTSSQPRLSLDAFLTRRTVGGRR
ncbi:hypothetical protein D7D94_04630 [Microbacterium oryzae]|uniref:Uncharacterized protein n=1 Tax=Microbacterium oryzae TaxID=743009 RepID=A0A6I6E6V0_9MICO|nr:hypothetical protein D7D94_04630 [Microbacterium oryzae]